MKKLLAIVLIWAPPALAEELQYPVDVAVDAKGNVFVADHEAHALLRLDGTTFRVVARGPGLPRTPLYGIRHIAPDREGRIVATDPATMKIYRIDAAGGVTPLPDDEQWVTPWGVAIEPDGGIVAVDRVTQRLRRVTASGKVEDVASVKAGRAPFFDSKGGLLLLTDRTVLRVERDGTTHPMVENPPFQFPHDALQHPNGNLYVSDGYARAVWQLSPSGKVEPLARGEPLVSPQGMALDGKGNLLVADPRAKTVFVVTTQGEVKRLVP